MPLDNYTKDFFKRIVRDMGTIVSRIDRLISVADRPREEDREAKHPQGAPTQEEYAAIGKILFSSHVNPSVETKNETKKHWYETFDGWKQKIEFVALFFAMGYAWITYCQWRDSAKNFRIDERALIKAGASTTPVHPDPNQYLTIEVAVINIGKNPARKVHVLSKIVKLDSDSEVNLQDLSAPYTNTEYGILYPNTPTAFRTNWTDMKHALSPSQTDMNAWFTGRIYFAVYGRIDYEDACHHPHWTTFCQPFVGVNTTTRTEDCTRFNDVDDNE